MKLIMEGASLLTGHYEDELNESSGNTERNYYISGIFSTPEQKNRNGRFYSRAIWEREVEKYQKEVTERSVNTLGEWQHPPRSTVDPLKAVLRIVELKINEDGNVWGRAKILNDNTEQTNKLKGLIKEGIKIGVSSRGVGKVSATGVVEDFKLITYDAVDMPSDYNAMLDGVVEGVQFVNGIAQDKEYRIDENDCVVECSLEVPAEKEEEVVEDAFKNVTILKDILAERDAEKLCDLSLEEKEEVLSEFSKQILGEAEIEEVEKTYIDEAIESIKEEIFSKIAADKAELIEGISEFLSNAKETDGIEISEATVEVKTNSIDEETAKKLLAAFSINEEDEEDEDKESEGKCKECGKDMDDSEKGDLCDSCEDKLEDDEKEEDEDEK